MACACHKAPAVLLDISIGPTCTCSQQQDSRQTSKQTDRYTQTHGPSAVSQQQQRAFPQDSRDFHPHLLAHAHTHVHKLQTPSLALRTARKQTPTHAPTHAPMHPPTHSHTLTHTHTLTRALALSLSLSLSLSLMICTSTCARTSKHASTVASVLHSLFCLCCFLSKSSILRKKE